ncbi:MAG: endopeptidase La [Chloroflexota bacterium]
MIEPENTGQDYNTFFSHDEDTGEEPGPPTHTRLRVPLLPLTENIVFPGAVYPLTLQGEWASDMIAAASRNDGLVALFLEKTRRNTDPTSDDLHSVGVLARLTGIRHGEHGLIDAEAEGLMPVRLVVTHPTSSHMECEVEINEQAAAEDEDQARAQYNAIRSLYSKLLSLNPAAEARLLPVVEQSTDPLEYAYLVASTIPISIAARQEILEKGSTAARLAYLQPLLVRALEIASRENAAESRQSRTGHLRALTPSEQSTDDFASLEDRFQSLPLPPAAAEVVKRELGRLAGSSPSSPDYGLVRGYLEVLADLPWEADEEATIDLEHARMILDRDHYGMTEVKERIVESLAVRKLRNSRHCLNALQDAAHAPTQQARQSVLCLVGPPGVGKTSLGRSIAVALDRPFARISLGGVSDEAEIRGHRRTYLGAMPGRVMQAVIRLGSSRPVIMLDELDKLGPKAKGDPAAALLDLLDPEQQDGFTDHYVDLPFDLSGVLFLATANNIEQVPEALRDRLEIIRLAGYTEEEKLQIALRHIVPRQMRWHALTGADLVWTEAGVHEIITGYTQEAGVRQLDRAVSTICRKVATSVAENAGRASRLKVDRAMVGEVLGTPHFLAGDFETTVQPGVTTGLFWTPFGGKVMHIESVVMAGGKNLTVTGQLGEVMRESARIALSYVRARAADLGIDPDFYEHHDIHMHVPSGAVAKDGPSAGITLAVSLVSLLTDEAVRPGIAMTGELTLRGRILPVGGIREKLLAAQRAGIQSVVLPAQNRADADKMHPDTLRDLELIFVETFDDVLVACFSRNARVSGKQAKRAQNSGTQKGIGSNDGEVAASAR